MDTTRHRPQQAGQDRVAAGRHADLLSDGAELDLPEQKPLRGQLRLLIPVLTVVFGAALDLTVVAPILPRFISDLNINTVDADRYSWIVLSYLVAYTVTVPLTGRVSDFVGHMPVFA